MPMTIDGTPFNLFPALEVPTVRSGVVWNTFAPRLGLTYDLTGDAKNVIMMDQRPLRSGDQQIVVHSAVKPTFAGVDPYNFYIDRNSDDNVKSVAAT